MVGQSECSIASFFMQVPPTFCGCRPPQTFTTNIHPRVPPVTEILLVKELDVDENRTAFTTGKPSTYPNKNKVTLAACWKPASKLWAPLGRESMRVIRSFSTVNTKTCTTHRPPIREPGTTWDITRHPSRKPEQPSVLVPSHIPPVPLKNANRPVADNSKRQKATQMVCGELPKDALTTVEAASERGFCIALPIAVYSIHYLQAKEAHLGVHTTIKVATGGEVQPRQRPSPTHPSRAHARSARPRACTPERPRAYAVPCQPQKSSGL